MKFIYLRNIKRLVSVIVTMRIYRKLGTDVLYMKFVLLSELLRTFVNLQKAAVVFPYVCPSVRLSVHM